MEKVILKAEVRKETGKRIAKDLRVKGLIPGNVYKSGKEATSLQLGVTELEQILHTKAGENAIITLEIAGAKERTVRIKEIQREPIHDRILHVDFNEISLTDLIKVSVPLAIHGEAAGVKIDGGLLERVLHELHIECLPLAIPAKIDVDVTNLKVGESILVKSIVVPEGVKVLNDPELIAVIVKAPKAEAAKVEGAEGEAPAEPELIRKKKEDEAAEGEAPKAAEKPEAEKK